MKIDDKTRRARANEALRKIKARERDHRAPAPTFAELQALLVEQSKSKRGAA